jgi:hypothetical protein
MKFRVTLKDPDGVYESVDEAARESLPPGLDRREADALAEIRREAFLEHMDKWFECNEYLTVEVDTDAGTCVVVPCGG